MAPRPCPRSRSRHNRSAASPAGAGRSGWACPACPNRPYARRSPRSVGRRETSDRHPVRCGRFRSAIGGDPAVSELGRIALLPVASSLSEVGDPAPGRAISQPRTVAALLTCLCISSVGMFLERQAADFLTQGRGAPRRQCDADARVPIAAAGRCGDRHGIRGSRDERRENAPASEPRR